MKKNGWIVDEPKKDKKIHESHIVRCIKCKKILSYVTRRKKGIRNKFCKDCCKIKRRLF